jgi:predicted acetyltransferase
MTISFEPTEFAAIRDAVSRHLNALPSAIDSFLEEHILESSHYKIFVAAAEAGFASIHQGSLLTQFALQPIYKRYGQAVFQQLKRLEEVQAAFVPSCDEFFLAHALDEYRQVNKQAYFFAMNPKVESAEVPLTLRLATKSDSDFVKESSGNFFGNIEETVVKERLYLVFSRETCVAFGVIHQSELLTRTASIGMYVIESFRKQGVGTATLQLLQQECQRQQLRAVAGCWYYNHLSKKTLECAGMFSQTRLFKIDF